MNQSSAVFSIVLSVLFPLIGYVGAIAYAIMQRHKSPKATRLLIFAIAVLFVSRAVSILAPIILAQTMPVQRMGELLLLLNGVSSFMHLVAFALLVFAIYVDRSNPEHNNRTAHQVGSNTPAVETGNPYSSPSDS